MASPPGFLPEPEHTVETGKFGSSEKSAFYAGFQTDSSRLTACRSYNQGSLHLEHSVCLGCLFGRARMAVKCREREMWSRPSTREKFTKAGLAEHLCAHFQREWRKSQGSKGECTAQQCLTLDHQSFIDSFCKKKRNKLLILPERTTCGSQRCRKLTRDVLECRKSYS